MELVYLPSDQEAKPCTKNSDYFITFYMFRYIRKLRDASKPSQKEILALETFSQTLKGTTAAH